MLEHARPLDSYERFSQEAKRVFPRNRSVLRRYVVDGVRRNIAKLVKSKPDHWVVNGAGQCERPVVSHFRAVDGMASYAEGRDRAALPLVGAAALRVTTVWRCRQCEWCRMMRRFHWSFRARSEFDRAATTWLLTFTISPTNHAWVDAKVAAIAHKTGASWLCDWTDKDLFAERCSVIGAEITKWLKAARQAEARVRAGWFEGVMPLGVTKLVTQAPPADFSYLLVAERHDSERTSTDMVGRPHYHMLIHERRPQELIKSADVYVTRSGEARLDDRSPLKLRWRLGWLQGKLCVDSDQASYLCKYLDPESMWRVRASENYGESIERCEERRSDEVSSQAISQERAER